MAENAKEWSRKEKEIRKDARRKYKGKRRAKATLYILLGALIAFLISLFSGLLGLNPIGFFSDGSGSHSLIKEQEATVPDKEIIKMVDESNVLRIIVNDDQYIYENVVYDLDGITQVIEGLPTISPIELVDQNALNGVFEAVEKVLNERSMEYNITEDYN